jgi:hypothetical protein
MWTPFCCSYVVVFPCTWKLSSEFCAVDAEIRGVFLTTNWKQHSLPMYLFFSLSILLLSFVLKWWMNGITMSFQPSIVSWFLLLYPEIQQLTTATSIIVKLNCLQCQRVTPSLFFCPPVAPNVENISHFLDMLPFRSLITISYSYTTFCIWCILIPGWFDAGESLRAKREIQGREVHPRES